MKPIFYRLKQETDTDALIPQYIAMRNEQYARQGIAYTDAERFFDQHPSTEFVIAIQNGLVVGGGRILKKQPGENFSLSFQAPPFESKFQQCLKDIEISLNDLTVLEIGGVVSASADPTEMLGARIQNELSKIARESQVIAASKIKMSNSLSVARTGLLQPVSIKTAIVPRLEYHGNEACLFLYTNEPQLYPAFDKLLSDGSALSPAEYIAQNKRQSSSELPAQSSLAAAMIVLAMCNTGYNRQCRHLVPADALCFYDAVKKICIEADPLINEANRTGRKMNRILDSVVNNGIAEHYALRKLLIEQQTKKLIKENGVEQIVVIGAGFDSMALRLHKRFPGIDFIEIDLPATQDLKKQSLARGLQTAQGKYRNLFMPANNFHFVAADLAKQPLDAVLAQLGNGFDTAKKTLFIAEGVSMYLTAEDNQKLIQAIHHSCRNKSFVLMGIAEETAMPDAAARTMKSYGEQYRWSLPHLAVKETMAGHGLNLLGEATYAQLQRTLPSCNTVTNPTGENYYLFETQQTFSATAVPLTDLTPHIPLSHGRYL